MNNHLKLAIFGILTLATLVSYADILPRRPNHPIHGGVLKGFKVDGKTYKCPKPGTTVNCFPGGHHHNDYCDPDVRDKVEEICRDVSYID